MKRPAKADDHSLLFNDLLPMYGITHSMPRAETPTDNAAMEAINRRIKAELFTDFHVTAEKPVAQEIEEYIVLQILPLSFLLSSSREEEKHKDSMLRRSLKRERAKNNIARLGMGETYSRLYIDDEDYLNTEKCGEPIHMVNTRIDGTYVHARKIAHAAKAVKREPGHPKFDFHSLRHTHATELSETGVNIKEIQRRLGHSTMEVTGKRDLHATKATKDESVRKMNEMFGG